MPIKEPKRINNGLPEGRICLADSLFYTRAGNERGDRRGCVYTTRFSFEAFVCSEKPNVCTLCETLAQSGILG